jgi:hypothetical protein
VGGEDFLFRWQRAIRGSDLTPTQRLVALTLSTWTDMRGEGARPGISRLCAATGLKKRSTVTAALAALERAALIECVHRGGLNAGASQYRARLGTSGTQCTTGAGDPRYPALGTSAAPAGHLNGASSSQDQHKAVARPAPNGAALALIDETCSSASCSSQRSRYDDTDGSVLCDECRAKAAA